MNGDIGRDLCQAYEDGLWDMFVRISTAYHGKQYYFREDSGTVYSRDSHKELTFVEAEFEFLSRIERE